MTDLAAHRAAGEPTRVTNNITINWGLVSLALAVFSGTEDGSAIKRSQFTSDGHPVGNQDYDKVTGATYTGAIVKRVQVGPDQWVELTDDEIAAVTGDVRGVSDIEAFVPLDSLGSTYVVTDVKQVRPAQLSQGKKRFENPAANKAFALLCSAMAEAEVAGLVKLTLRSAARYGAVTPDGRLLMLAFADQVRADRPTPEVDLSDAETAMARQLIEMTGVDTPVLVDDAGVKLHAYVKAKAAGGELAVVAEPEAAPVPDLMAALEASLKAAGPGKVTEGRKSRPSAPRKRTPAKTAAATTA